MPTRTLLTLNYTASFANSTHLSDLNSTISTTLVESPSMMEMQVQFRPHSSHARSTPRPRAQSLDQKLSQGDQFLKAKKQLDSKLQNIEDRYSSSSQIDLYHSGQDDCERCAEKKRRLASAYLSYYLEAMPQSWIQQMSFDYRKEIEKTFENQEASLDDLHAVFRSGVRDYLKQSMAPKFTHQELTELFSEDRDTTKILTICLERIKNKARNPETSSFIADLQHARTPEERARLYIKYHCTPSSSDPSNVKNFKAKYARMFEQLRPYDEVVAAMRKEAGEAKQNKLAGLHRQLNELEMAQSAHMKAKARKDQKMRDRGPDPGVVQCSLPGCANEIDLARDETIECCVCEWLESRGSEKGRAFYCCVEHAEDNFDQHDREDHQCCMGARCFYYPLPGPPGETGDGGVCQDCADEDFTSYFCSQDCYHHNLDLHRDDFHMGKHIHNDSNMLEMFRPAGDMELVT